MIKFGPSGNSQAFAQAGNSKSEQSAVWVKNMGLDAFEYSFGRGVLMSEERAVSIGNAFKNEQVDISVHAPYYVNFANPDLEMANKSFGYIIDSAKMLGFMQGKRVIFHPASQGKESREVAVNRTIDRFKMFADLVYTNDMQNFIYCPETMGKIAQIGTIEEVTTFCLVDKIFTPTVDFGHVNAREQGSLKTANDYKIRLEYMLEKLGYERMKHFHIHFSKIMYSAKGEIKHLNFDDQVYGPEFYPLAQALVDLKLEPVVICESAGMQDLDALSMKKDYYSLIKNN